MCMGGIDVVVLKDMCTLYCVVRRLGPCMAIVVVHCWSLVERNHRDLSTFSVHLVIIPQAD